MLFRHLSSRLIPILLLAGLLCDRSIAQDDDAIVSDGGRQELLERVPLEGLDRSDRTRLGEEEEDRSGRTRRGLASPSDETQAVVEETFRDDLDAIPPPPVREATRTNVAAYQVQRRVTHQTLAVKDDHVLVEVRFQPLLSTRFPARLEHRFWAVAPEDSVLTAEIVEADWFVVEEELELTNGPFPLTGDETWGALPNMIQHIRTAHVDQVRGVPLHRIEMNVVQNVTNVKSKGLATAWVSRMVVRVNLPGLATAPHAAFNDPYVENLLRAEVVNPQHISRAYIQPAPLEDHAALTEWNERLKRAHEAGFLVSGKLPRGGVYSILPDDLTGLGFDTTSLDLDRLRFFVGQQEVPVLMDLVRRDRLVGNSRILFHAPFDPSDRKPYHSFWIMRDPDGPAPLRTTGRPPRVPNEYEPRGTTPVTIFEPVIYNHKMGQNAPQLNWASAQIPPYQYASFEFQAPATAVDQPVSGRLFFTMLHAGANTGDATLVAYVNGREFYRGHSRTTRVMNESVTIPAGFLRAGTNTLAIQSLEPERGIHGQLQFIQADFKMPVTSASLPLQALMTVTDEIASTNTVFFTNPTGDRMPGLLVDSTDPKNPLLVRLDPINRGGTFGWLGPAPAGGTNRLWSVASFGSAFPVVDLAVTAPPRSFLDREQLDYLIIAHSTLVDPLKPLVERRREKYRTEVYTIEDVYNAFNGGEVSYQAIHRAIRHTFQSRQNPPIQAVLLVGEGSEYWWEHRRATIGVSPNMVPVYGWQDGNVPNRGDDSYTLLTGKGHISDVELGRLSTEDPMELEAMITKMLRYEMSPPTGDWRHRHLFVADDEPEFADVCREIVTKTFSGANFPHYMFLQDFPYEDYFRGFWRKRSTTMTEELLRRWAEGALTITYLGHGGPNLWSSERILHNRDVENISDGGRHPFLVAGSCDTGWVDYPIEPVRASLSEQLTRNPNGGAIAAFIPIDGTSSFEHNFLLTALFESMMQRGERRFGTITLLSKMNYFLPRSNSRVTNQFLLMGDPLMELPAQSGEIRLSASPKEFLKGARGEIAVEGQFPGVPWGIVDVVLLNPDQQVASREKMRLVNSYFSGNIALPLDFTPGTYRLMAIAVSDSSAQQGSASVPIEVHDHQIRFNWTTEPATNNPLRPGTPVQITMNVTNEAPLPLTNAELVIEDYLGRETFRATVSARPGEVLTETFTSPIPPGVSTIAGKLFLAGEKVRPVAQDRLMLIGRHPDRRAFDVILGDSRVEYLRSDAGMQFVLPIVVVGDQPLRHSLLRLQVDDEDTSVTIGDRRILFLDRDARRDFVFRTDRVLASGNKRLALQLVDPETDSVRFSLPFEYDLGRGPDLEIVPGSVFVENMNPRAGNTVFLRFDVRNSGDRPAYGVRTHLYLNRPWDESEVAPNSTPWGYTRAVPVMLPGERRTFRQRWDPSGAAASRVTLFPAVSGIEGEANLANNVAAVPVSLMPSSNLRLLANEARISHDVVQPYDRVRFSIPFANDSNQDFLQEFRVTATAMGAGGVSRRILSTRYDSMSAGARGVLQFDWLVNPGEDSVEVNVNADREYLELTYDDNQHVFHFPYVFPVSQALDGDGNLDFERILRFATRRDLNRSPDGAYHLVTRPRGLSQSLRYTPQNLVGGRFSTEYERDNLAQIFRETEIRISPGEDIEPVRFRFPLNTDFGTTVYEIESRHVPFAANQARPTGIFRYRLGDSPDWIVENRVRGSHGRWGVHDTGDNNLLLEIASTPEQAANHLLSLIVYPVTGELTSPLLRTREPIRGRLVAEYDAPGTSRVDLFVRYAIGHNKSLDWSDWVPIRSGDALPRMPENATYFQWRARLVASVQDRPVLRGIRIESEKAGRQRAAVSMMQEAP